MRCGKESKQIRLLLQFVNQFATSKWEWYTRPYPLNKNQVFTTFCRHEYWNQFVKNRDLLVIIIMRIVDIIIIYMIPLSSSLVSNT